MPDKVELIYSNESRNFMPRNLRFLDMERYGFPKSDLTLGDVYNLVEPKLETEEQKNAVKAVLNAFGYGDPEESEIGSSGRSVLEYLGKVYKGEKENNKDVRDLIWNLKSELEYVLKRNPDKYYPNLEVALANVYKDPGIAWNISYGINDNILEQRKKHNLIKLSNEDYKFDLEHRFRELDKDVRQVFPVKSLSVKQLADMIDYRLENDEQRNAVRELLNRFEFSYHGRDNVMLTTFINDSAALLNGNLTADSYMDKLYSDLKRIAESRQDPRDNKISLTRIRNERIRAAREKKNAENTSGTLNEGDASVQKKEENASVSVKAGEGSVQKQEPVNTGKIVKESISLEALQKKEEISSKTADVSEASAQKKEEIPSKTADVNKASAQKKEEHSPWTPDVDEGSVRFFKVTVKEANDVRGRWNDSPEYMNFYNAFRSAGEMMAVLYAAKQHDYNSVAVDPKKLSDNTRSILQRYNSEGKIKISTAKLTQVYKNTYGNIAKYAKVYEDYKHKTKSPNEYNAKDVGKLNITGLFTDSPEVSMPSKGKKRSL